MARLLPLLAVLLAVSAAQAGVRTAPAAPSVSGPRTTTSQEPAFAFRAAGAVRFLCAFDSPSLHGCTARYSQWLTVGSHVLRVQAVSRAGARSRVVSVTVAVTSSTGLYTDLNVRVGRGAGVPAVDGGSVWVPDTGDGTVVHFDVASKRVVATIKLGTPPTIGGYLDSAVAAGGSIWVARDSGGEVDRIDPATNRLVARIPVAARPGGLAAGGGYVWAFHFADSTVTRIDAATNAKREFTVSDGTGTGIAYVDGAVWVLYAAHDALIKLDPATGAVLTRIQIDHPAPAKHSIVSTWWLAAGGGSLWAVDPNFDTVTRVDPATGKVAATIPVPLEQPFGIAYGDGAAWVGGAGRVVRVDPATNTVTGTIVLTPSQPIFTQVVAGDSGLWATDYDAGRLYHLHTG